MDLFDMTMLHDTLPVIVKLCVTYFLEYPQLACACLFVLNVCIDLFSVSSLLAIEAFERRFHPIRSKMCLFIYTRCCLIQAALSSAHDVDFKQDISGK